MDRVLHILPAPSLSYAAGFLMRPTIAQPYAKIKYKYAYICIFMHFYSFHGILCIENQHLCIYRFHRYLFSRQDFLPILYFPDFWHFRTLYTILIISSAVRKNFIVHPSYRSQQSILAPPPHPAAPWCRPRWCFPLYKYHLQGSRS